MRSTIDETISHVSLLARHRGLCNLRSAILIALMELRTPTKCLGFELLTRATVLQYEDPTRSLKNDIYAEILLHTKLNSEQQIDQAIREVIKTAWDEGSKEAWCWYFGYKGELPKRRPSNGEFISRIAYVVELWLSCEKGETEK